MKTIRLIHTSLLLIAFAGLLISCKQSATKDNNGSSTANEQQSGETVVYKVEDLLKEADQLTGKTVQVQGQVCHVCKHSDRRFKITGLNGTPEIRIDINPKLQGVDQDILGKIAVVKGKIVCENLNVQQIKALEDKIRTNHKGEEHTAHFKEEIAAIDSIRLKVESGEMPYYATYHIEAEGFRFISQ